MAGRPEIGPGQWKTRQSQAGGTRFVEPELVPGTLEKGWETLRGLRTAFQRSAMMMFLITETHPFNDGNGRLARAFMNAELVEAGERRIIIPPVYRGGSRIPPPWPTSRPPTRSRPASRARGFGFHSRLCSGGGAGRADAK
jgi:hypothetical protein